MLEALFGIDIRIAEGAAACAVAAAISGSVRGRVVAIVSGGNIDLSTFVSLVGACPDGSPT